MNAPSWKRSRHATTGSVLITSVVAAGILSILAAGVLAYMRNELGLNVRSHSWTQALHLAEGAVEIGFAELNYPHLREANGFRADRGWSPLGGNGYTWRCAHFTNSAGQVTGGLAVTVDDVGSDHPVILGVGTIAGPGNVPTLSRAVRVHLAPSSRFPLGVVARQSIDLKGNRIYTDSFNSTDPAKSTDGRYDPAKRQPNGDIATNGELRDTVNVGNADIYGIVHTGAGGAVAIAPQGSVGPTFVESDRATSVSDGEAAGWIVHDFATDIPAVTLPPGLENAPRVGSIDTDTTLASGDWRADAIQLNASERLTITGTVRLHVTGDLSIMGTTAAIVIAPGAQLEIYAGGAVAIAGSGVVNQTGTAVSNQFYGLPTSTSWSLGGNGQWVGTVYAPQANLTLNGGGTTGDMSGAIVANRITLTGQVQFHYDESLRDNPAVMASYIVVSWQSLFWDGTAWQAE